MGGRHLLTQAANAADATVDACGIRTTPHVARHIQPRRRQKQPPRLSPAQHRFPWQQSQVTHTRAHAAGCGVCVVTWRVGPRKPRTQPSGDSQSSDCGHDEPATGSIRRPVVSVGRDRRHDIGYVTVSQRVPNGYASSSQTRACCVHTQYPPWHRPINCSAPWHCRRLPKPRRLPLLAAPRAAIQPHPSGRTRRTYHPWCTGVQWRAAQSHPAWHRGSRRPTDRPGKHEAIQAGPEAPRRRRARPGAMVAPLHAPVVQRSRRCVARTLGLVPPAWATAAPVCTPRRRCRPVLAKRAPSPGLHSWL